MMRSIYIAALLFATFGLKAQSDLDTASKAFAEGDYLEALTVAEHCFSEDSLQVSCAEIAANASYKLGDQSKAKEFYHIVEELDTNNTYALAQLAGIYEQQMNVAKATRYYSMLNKKLPDNPIYFRKNAKLFKSINDHATAFRLYARANKLNPRDALTLKGLAEICIGNNQLELADSLIQCGLAMDSENVSMYYILARSKYRQKQYDTVMMVLESLSSRTDLNSYYNKLLGFSYLQLDSLDLAIHKLQLALADEKEAEKLHFYLATAYEKKGMIEGALEHYNKAAIYGRSPDLGLYHRNVGRLAYNQKKYKDAIAHYKDAYKYSKDPVILYYLATACDTYYKDKSIGLNYFKKYIKSGHHKPDYQQYARQRSQYLKEYLHQTKKKI